MNARNHSINAFLIWLAIGMLTLNLFTMLFWHFRMALNSWIYVVVAVALLLPLKGDPRKITLISSYILVLGIALVGEPAIDWDTRSIWFFHAKKLFFDGGYHTQLSDYASFSHNDYPVLVPALTAAIARTAGFWSESLPKLSLIMVIAPAVFITATVLKTRFLLFWLIGISLIGSRFLVNGYMDAVLGVYFAAIVMLLIRHNLDSKSDAQDASKVPYLVTLALMTASLALIKNEGLMMVLTLGAVSLVFYRHMGGKTLVALGLGVVIFYALWKYHVSAARIPSDLFTTGLMDRLLARITSSTDLFQLLAIPAVHVGLFLTLYLLVAAITQTQAHHLFVLLTAFAYLGGMLLIYAITPHNLQWHIATSANRTMMPVNIVLFSMLVYTIQYIERLIPEQSGS